MTGTEKATLHIHICADRRGYNVTFSTQDQAIAFLQARTATHNWWEIDGGSIPATWDALIDFMYPLCQHGLSADLCHGPDHYMSAAEEAAMDFQYMDSPPGF